ncbi:unnamed protein product [Brassica oleracea var. botrytis]|uniref:(rape) hypothetical protein n=1 Tax=Brassica napus TaxID=3708 RepID=A0A816K4F6_BRANA|nr:unnamed protein product [Brassica napus]
MVPNVELHLVNDLGRLCTAWLQKQDFPIPQLVPVFQMVNSLVRHGNFITMNGLSKFLNALEQVDEAISFLESSENVLVPVTATLGLKKRSLTSRARKE